MKLKESDIYTELYNLNNENFYDDQNKYVKHNLLQLPN